MSRTPEAVKLFIGQIPKDYTERDVRLIFEPYGEIHSFNMLEDKATGQHKGCAFLTYFSNDSAKRAQEQLHGKQTLPGARNPIQVKPSAAEVSPENRKLFCGMLSRSLGEGDVRAMFSPYGSIEEVTVLRANGVSKGCAFVLMETRQQAQNAIRAMHHSETMDGCSSPMVVKLADSGKDKATKSMMGIVGGSPVCGGGGVQMSVGGGGGGVSTMSELQQQAIFYQQLFNQLVLPQIMAGNLPSPGSPGAMTALVSAMAAQAQSLDAGNGSSLLAQAFQSQFSSGGLMSSSYNSFQHNNNNNNMNIDAKQEEGPDGANLFIYQIPPEYTDSDLSQLFTPFGKVLSAKVFLDKTTNMSKGFGFVSFLEPECASNAITSMNGFIIGNKRLRVALKKKKDVKPY